MFENLFISASVCGETISKRVKGWFSESSPPGHHAWAVELMRANIKEKASEMHTPTKNRPTFTKKIPFPFYFPSLPVFSEFNF